MGQTVKEDLMVSLSVDSYVTVTGERREGQGNVTDITKTESYPTGLDRQPVFLQ